ncbi:MAG: hypothetical protein JXN61_04205 [Sedimentisphaerales bacterium]|nr:hypothetical protein [Sedimentisphaerales bacterium]
MFKRGTLRFMHLAGTVWFMLCFGYVLVQTLRQAGVRWWVLFSLSGHGVLLVFMSISLYLFAIFRGVSASQIHQIEHPLTSTGYYTVFYVTIPFLGGLAGCLGMIGVCTMVQQFLQGVALGTLAATFLVWVIVDPVAGVLEVWLSPGARRHRAQRVAQAKLLRDKEHQERERLLADILEREDRQKQQWAELLKPLAEKLADLLTAERIDFEAAERQAADIGASAWRIGGIGCMRLLREMAIEICKKQEGERQSADYISVWWDGIGNWRNHPLQMPRG